MGKKDLLLGILISIADKRGPCPLIWYPPNFADIAQIHNSAVKSFSLLFGDKIYREKAFHELTCFGILPFLDLNAVGIVHLSGIHLPGREDLENPQHELPFTITLMFNQSYRDELCQNSPKIHQFLEGESKALWGALQEEHSAAQAFLAEFFQKVAKFVEQL